MSIIFSCFLIARSDAYCKRWLLHAEHSQWQEELIQMLLKYHTLRLKYPYFRSILRSELDYLGLTVKDVFFDPNIRSIIQILTELNEKDIETILGLSKILKEQSERK